LLMALMITQPAVLMGEVDHWETVIYAGDNWRYFVGISNPPGNWISPGFDETAWLSGKGGFGYGDNDDGTEIQNCISVYLRKTFTIDDVNKIDQVLLHMDYDDAFIAFLNETEIARSGGIQSDRPAYDYTSTVNHEALLYQGGLPEAFFVSGSVLVQGENVLAIQVHNASNSSSDLSSNGFLSVGINVTSTFYGPTPPWFEAAKPFAFTSSDIPIMVIDTQGRSIRDEPKTMARMGIIYNGEGNRNEVSDGFNEYDGWIGIEYRGNASMGISDKKPFTFETRNEDGSDNNVALLGLPAENDFILRAAFIDKTLMRDALAYYISRSIGRWAPRTRHVELILNGSYEGIYVLNEKIKPDKNRLNIVRMDSTDNSGLELTGGYVWSVQQADGNDVVFDPHERDGNSRVIKYPKPDEITPEQLQYISELEQALCDLRPGPSFRDPNTGYPSFIDLSSFLDEIIVQEITSNSDAYGWSGFFHKDRGGKICAGPAWDFDQSLANSTYNDGARTDEWIILKSDGSRPPFWDYLMQETYVQEQITKKWNQYRNGPLRTERIFAFIDSVAAYLNEAQGRNFTRWPILGVEVWRSVEGARERDTYQKEVDYMKDWLLDHLAWMDEEWYLDPSPVIKEKNAPEGFQLSFYPNPFRQNIQIRYHLNFAQQVRIGIYNVLGREVHRFNVFIQPEGWHSMLWNGFDMSGKPVSKGIYFIRAETQGNKIFTAKIVKY
ncbi:CotH kinase family protein, partial [candidate division KSB1 bacterium]|nr:CotH kinase family protein [candidate division KSB1 bacterium]